MEDRRDNNDFNNLFELFDLAKSFYSDNEEQINKFLEGDKTISFREGKALKQAESLEDETVISLETNADDMSDISIGYDRENVELTISADGDKIRVKLPLDSMVGQAVGSINNGVVTISVPRDRSGDLGNIEEETDE